MRITRIDLEGKPGRYATCQRRVGGVATANQLLVQVVTPEDPNGRRHYIQPDCEEDLWSMAECLQERLEGQRGTGSDVHAYYQELLRLSDL